MNEDSLLLRPIQEADTANIIMWRNSPEVRLNFIFQEILTEDMHMDWLNNYVKLGKAAQFIMVDTMLNNDIGSIYLRDIDYKNKKAEFGIFIGDNNARGKGYGTLATKKILTYAFDELKLNKVFLRVFATNTGAVKSYEKAGFITEGLFREDVMIDGEPVDVIFMAVFNPNK